MEQIIENRTQGSHPETLLHALAGLLDVDVEVPERVAHLHGLVAQPRSVGVPDEDVVGIQYFAALAHALNVLLRAAPAQLELEAGVALWKEYF